ncbi:MAG: imidazole glycerol phosphate synthase subunit HisH [Clostridia bacterium]|nr:imidazole glycerol phosphate synthase subunit HisH [Clostridia bacterium]
MIAIVDYGVGNLFSLKCSFAAVGENAVVTSDKTAIKNAGKIVLPGVGAFGDAARKLKAQNLDKLLKDEAAAGKPILGICLGMQLLFDKSFEYGEHEGLSLIPGAVRPIGDVIGDGLKIPHMGWNELRFCGQRHNLFKYLSDGDYVYFVHSYYADTPREYVLATAEYGAPLTAAAANGNVAGCQFHPEKSGKTGLKILKAFCETE